MLQWFIKFSEFAEFTEFPFHLEKTPAIPTDNRKISSLFSNALICEMVDLIFTLRKYHFLWNVVITALGITAKLKVQKDQTWEFPFGYR